MMCDIILASPSAKFGQPEINLGIIPAGGATQRLTHAIGKSRAMEIILTGRNFSAQEAEKWGLVSRIVGEGEGVVVKEAVAMAKTIASKGQIAVQTAKETVNAGKLLYDIWVYLLILTSDIAYELSLAEGLRLERRLFHGLFATQDQKEGMSG
jgi:enoyl-CoA hydratase